jgi:hypothetical protein
MMAILTQKQREKRKQSPAQLANLKPFQRGKSGNPGGLPQGTPKVKIALLNMLALPPDELGKIKPSTVAEELALKQIKRALGYNDTPVKDVILATEKIADRTEGKATEHKEITGKNGEPLFGDVELEKQKYERIIAAHIKKYPTISREQTIEDVGIVYPDVYKYVQE